MANINTNDEYGSYIKYSGNTGTYTYSYSSLSLNDSVADIDQLIVLRKFTPSVAYVATATPDGLGGTEITGEEWWDVWTLPRVTSSGSDMYSIDTTAKTITMTTETSSYEWDRSGTTINLPVFDPSTDTLIIARKTYGVTPLVTWSPGSRLTADQLNHETKQLLNLTQEIQDKFFRLPDLNPYYGKPNGLCPLNASGAISSDYIDANSLDLGGTTVATGDGLTGGGALSSDLLLSIDITSVSPMSFSSGELAGPAVHGNYLQTVSNALEVKLKTDGGLSSDSTGIFVELTDSVTLNDSTIALSAAGGKIIQDSIDLLPTGVQYLGNFTPGSVGTEPTPPSPLVIGMTYDVIAAGTTTDGGNFEDDNGDPLTVVVGDYIRYKTNGSTGWYVAKPPLTVVLTDYFKHDGTIAATGNWDMSDNLITSLKPPVAATDAATKGYVDTLTIASISDSYVIVTTPATNDLIFYRESSSSWEPIALNNDYLAGHKILSTGSALGDLNDVTVTDPQDNDIIIYDSATSSYKNSGIFGNPQTYYSSGTGIHAITSTTGTHPSGTGYGDGTVTVFSLSGETPTSDKDASFILSLDGIQQIATIDYTVTGTTLRFTSAPPYGAEIYAVVFGLSHTVSGAIEATTITAEDTITAKSNVEIGNYTQSLHNSGLSLRPIGTGESAGDDTNYSEVLLSARENVSNDDVGFLMTKTESATSSWTNLVSIKWGGNINTVGNLYCDEIFITGGSSGKGLQSSGSEVGTFYHGTDGPSIQYDATHYLSVQAGRSLHAGHFELTPGSNLKLLGGELHLETNNGIISSSGYPGKLSFDSSGLILKGGSDNYIHATPSRMFVAGKIHMNSGVIEMNSNRITELEEPIYSDDAVTKNYVDILDAATRNYVDTLGGQTWQDVTSSRAANTEYTNDTGKAIHVSTSWTDGASGPSIALQVKVAGAGSWITVAIAYTQSHNTTSLQIAGVVPAGDTYRLQKSANISSLTLENWTELR